MNLLPNNPETGPQSIDDLRAQIDELDAEILNLVRQRQKAGVAAEAIRVANGGTKLVHAEEMRVITHYSQLGADGKDIAMLLLRMSRGRLGQPNVAE